MKNVKTNKGITLIALVVTIIVLLILAAVTIGLVLGQNGIIGKANKAKNAADIASGKDQVQLALAKVVADKLENGQTTSDIKAEDLQTELQKTDLSASVTGTNPNFTAKYRVNEVEYEYGINTDTQTVMIKDNNENSGDVINLVDVVKEGDFVNYNAGKWEEEKEMPSSAGEFGGYKLGTSRNDSIEIVVDEKKYKPMYNGWRVLSVDKEHDIIRLIHAGIPEAYYNAEESRIRESDMSKYVDWVYARSAKIFDGDIMREYGNADYDTPEWVRSCNSYWWIDNSYTIYYSWNSTGSALQCAEPDGELTIGGSAPIYANCALGIRPVITLKSGLKTSGQKKEIVGTDGTTQAMVWQLVEPIYGTDNTEFNSKEWDKTATEDDYFVWKSDVEGEEGYNTIVGYQEKMSSLYKIKIPSRCTSIELNEVFLGMGNSRWEPISNITKIELPENISYIGRNTFERFKALRDISIPKSVTTIEDSAFEECEKLTEIKIPNNVNTIGEYAFYNCTSLTTVYTNNQTVISYMNANYPNVTIKPYEE